MATATRELSSPPGLAGLYAKAAAPMVPLASKLAFVGGGGGKIPEFRLALSDVAVDPEQLAAYNRVCGFGLADTLPSTYPHILAFPLHMALMTDASFPFPAVGLVHIENRIVQHRPIHVREKLDLTVYATPLESHPKGRQFTIVSEGRVGGELVWEDFSTNLRRGGGASSDEKKPASSRKAPPPVSSTWRLSGDLGRRYAAVAGDRNPIHMHDLSAKLFGFPRAIAHGMWTKAHCLAQLQGRLPDAYEVDVAFKKPILLPAKATFGSETEGRGGNTIRFSVRDPKKDAPHLDGTVSPAPKTTRRKKAS